MGVLRRAATLFLVLQALATTHAPRTFAATGRALLVPPLEGAEVVTVAVERDGTRRLISRGVRVLLTTQGELSIAEEALPLDKSPVAVELPPRFGGGYLFATASAGRTSLWKSRAWAGALEPFADIDFEVGRIVPGFDRLHLQARRSGEWGAIDAESGAGVDRGNLPLAPSFGAMAFVDSWFGAVELPVRGTVVSFDAGASWHPLGIDAAGLSVQGGALLIGNERSAELLGTDGRFRPAPIQPDKGEARVARISAEGALGRLPLRTAILRGIPGTANTALVVSRGVLARVRLDDGKVLAQNPRALPATRECSGVRLGKGHGFVCGEVRGKTEIYGVVAPLGLRLERSFDSARAVTSSDNGALVVSGGCGASSVADGERRRCILSPGGTSFELVLSGSGRERIAALHDGRAAVLEPPNAGAPGSLRLVDAEGRSRSVVLSVHPDANGTLLKTGFWLNGLVESSPGVLAGWVVARGSFMGVRVTLEGKVSAGASQRRIEDALVSGSRALVLGVSGIAEQSSDGGFTWDEAGMPATVEASTDSVEAAAAEPEQGCSLVGCVFRRWLRVGWRSGARPLRAPPRPEPTVLPAPGGGRFRLTCEFDGQYSPPSLPIAARPGYGSGNVVPSPWLPLLDVAPPPLTRDRVGVDVGTESELVQLRAYVFGPKTDFARGASFLLRVADRYRVEDSVWSTSPTPSPWPDFEQAVDAFGYEGSGVAGWRLALDPSGDAGVLSVNWRGTTDLYLVERNRVVRRIPNAPRLGLGVVTSAVRLGATFYVATTVDTRTFRVFALEQQSPRLVGEYRDVPFGGTGSPMLVRTARAAAARSGNGSPSVTERDRGLGLWARGVGWFVFPIDEQTGVAAPALEISARALSRMPRVCAGDEEGYLLEGALPLEPLVEWRDTARSARAAVRAVEGRFVVVGGASPLSGLDDTGGGPRRGSADICVRALAAQADRPVREARSPTRPRRARSEVAASVPFVLSDRGEGGRRYGLRCGESD